MMRVAAMSLLVAVAALSAGAPQLVSAQEAGAVTVSDKFPTTGKSTTIKTDTLEQTVELTYSPGSKVEAKETVKAQGTRLVLWRPQRPGVVSIAAPNHATKNVSVRFDGVPLSGLVIMMLAGAVLFGGALFSLRSLLAEQ